HPRGESKGHARDERSPALEPFGPPPRHSVRDRPEPHREPRRRRSRSAGTRARGRADRSQPGAHRDRRRRASALPVPPMKRTRLGSLDVWSAGGEDREGGGTGPAIVLCHGFGAPGDDLASLWRAVDVGRGVRWFFPEAPLDLSAMFGAPARAWW